MKSITEWISQHQEEQKQWLEKLVNIDSGSEDREGILRVSEEVTSELQKLGFKVEQTFFDHAGPCLVARKPGKSEGPEIVLLGHMDTVFPKGTVEKRPYTEKEGKAFGPGVLDMKGGISQIVFALKALTEQGVSTEGIRVLLVGDEEVGHLYSDAVQIMKEQSEGAAYNFCCESGRTSRAFVTGRKGVGSAYYEVFGKAAHSGNDILAGRNAILEISHQILRLNQFNEDDLTFTLSAGVIQGGTAINVVPDYAKVEIDLRFTDKEKFNYFERESKKILEDKLIPETHYKYQVNMEYQTMSHDENTEKILAVVAQGMENLSLGKPESLSVGGGADSSFLAGWGIPSICAFGPCGGSAHTEDEYIELKSLEERTQLLAECIRILRK